MPLSLFSKIIHGAQGRNSLNMERQRPPLDSYARSEALANVRFGSHDYSIPVSRICEESDLLQKILTKQAQRQIPFTLQIPNEVDTSAVEAFVYYLASNNHYNYPEISNRVAEIAYHTQVCRLADTYGVDGLWFKAFEWYRNRLEKYWINLNQYDKENLINLVYQDSHITEHRDIKNKLLGEIASTAVWLTQGQQVDDDRAYGNSKLGFNSLIAIISKIRDDKHFRALWKCVEGSIVELGSCYFNMRRTSLMKRTKSRSVIREDIEDIVCFRRRDRQNIPEKEKNASEAQVVLHWVRRMIEWHIYRDARDELFEDLSKNPFGGFDNEKAELLA